MIRMEIVGLTFDASTREPILVLREANSEPGADPRALPIWLGRQETMILNMMLNDVPLRRPLAHDLLFQALERLGGQITGVSLTDLREGTFYARIDLMVGDRLCSLDSRPFDAVLLALRTDCELWVADQVLINSRRGRVNPKSEADRRPLDSEEALIREAAQELLEKTGHPMPHYQPFQPPDSAKGEHAASDQDDPYADSEDREVLPQRPVPGSESSKAAGGLAGFAGPHAGADALDEDGLADLLSRLDPASFRRM